MLLVLQHSPPPTHVTPTFTEQPVMSILGYNEYITNVCWMIMKPQWRMNTDEQGTNDTRPRSSGQLMNGDNQRNANEHWLDTLNTWCRQVVNTSMQEWWWKMERNATMLKQYSLGFKFSVIKYSLHDSVSVNTFVFDLTYFHVWLEQ